MEKEMIEQMRTDFQVVVIWRKTNDGWRDADAEELGQNIKMAIARGDSDIVQSYANWLRREAIEHGK